MPYHVLMNWNVYFSEKAAKQAKKLNKRVISILDLLVSDLRNYGAAPGKGWSNYGKLKGKGKQIDIRHCHLTNGKPTYICCWEVKDKQREIEVNDVGTHEKAPY